LPLAPTHPVVLGAGAEVFRLGEEEPSVGVGGDRGGLGCSAAGDVQQLARVVELVAQRVGVSARACERCQFGLCAESLGAQLDADLSGPALLYVCQTLPNGRVGVGPATLPERKVCDVRVVVTVEAKGAPLGQRGAHGLQVRSRGVELAAADLDAGARLEHLVAGARDGTAERRGAECFCLVPLPDR
jgi:hypothetical protein